MLLVFLMLLSGVGTISVPDIPVVVMPSTPVPPPPTPPAPVPGQPTVLAPNALYVINASASVIVLASPEGIVKITPDTGPIKIRGIFVDGTQTETKTFPGPFVYIVEAVGTGGSCELIVVPSMVPKSVIRRTLRVGALPPDPPIPVPPAPPVPPVPSPAPIPVDGFRVLMVYESSDLSKLPPGQLSILYGQQVRDYMTSKAAMGPDGKTKEWRILDADTIGDSPLWQAAMKRPRASLPWVVISDGHKGFEGPLPKTEAEMMTLLKSIGG